MQCWKGPTKRPLNLYFFFLKKEQYSRTAQHLKKGPIVFPVTLVTNYRTTLRKISEESRSRLHHDGSLQSSTFHHSFYWTRKIIYFVYKNVSLVPNLSRINPVRTFPCYICKHILRPWGLISCRSNNVCPVVSWEKSGFRPIILPVLWKGYLVTRARDTVLPHSLLFLPQVHMLVHIVLNNSQCTTALAKKLRRENYTVLLLEASPILCTVRGL